jgi:uncharacterized protein YihD (DUF1040 family)
MARDPARIPEVLALIQTAWDELPDMRLGQLLINAVGEEANLFYLEDDVLIDALQEWIETSKTWTSR